MKTMNNVIDFNKVKEEQLSDSIVSLLEDHYDLAVLPLRMVLKRLDIEGLDIEELSSRIHDLYADKMNDSKSEDIDTVEKLLAHIRTSLSSTIHTVLAEAIKDKDMLEFVKYRYQKETLDKAEVYLKLINGNKV
jgi:hypothetical protein